MVAKNRTDVDKPAYVSSTYSMPGWCPISVDELRSWVIASSSVCAWCLSLASMSQSCCDLRLSLSHITHQTVTHHIVTHYTSHCHTLHVTHHTVTHYTTHYTSHCNTLHITVTHYTSHTTVTHYTTKSVPVGQNIPNRLEFTLPLYKTVNTPSNQKD